MTRVGVTALGIAAVLAVVAALAAIARRDEYLSMKPVRRAPSPAVVVEAGAHFHDSARLQNLLEDSARLQKLLEKLEHPPEDRFPVEPLQEWPPIRRAPAGDQ
jgi:hypothetical protein